jgi:hypothetical protein
VLLRLASNSASASHDWPGGVLSLGKLLMKSLLFWSGPGLPPVDCGDATGLDVNTGSTVK